MALTFTRATAVEEGSKPTSTQLKNLARAFNDRLRLFSFCSWRLIWYWFNLFRQVRNPAEGGFVFPAQGEFFYVYQHLDPEIAPQNAWPLAGPGDPEGSNLANPAMQFIFGIEDPFGGPGVDSEEFRINNIFQLPTPASLADLWALGKLQRGVYDPLTGAQTTPAWDVAQSHFRITQPFWSPHGKALGGWLPRPTELLPSCGSTEAGGLGIPSYEIKFTGLRAGLDVSAFHHTGITVDADGIQTITYAGTCPCGADFIFDLTGHVLGIAYGPLAYHVYVSDGTGNIVDGCGTNLDTLPLADWLEGPYTAEGQLAHTTGNQLGRALWTFHKDFRGTPLQRDPDTFKIKQIAFDNQAFFTSQYPLSPNIGRLDGDTLVDEYPRATWSTGTGHIAAGTLGTFPFGVTTHEYETDFVLGGAFAQATKLRITTQIGLYNDEQLLATLVLVPDTNGDASAMIWIGAAVRPNPLKIRLINDANFTGGEGTLECEVTEQVPYKPQAWDAYLVSRVTATSGGDKFNPSVDGGGRNYTQSADISQSLLTFGCLTNTSGVREQFIWASTNPVIDSARRLSRDHARITRRQQLVSYEVSGGKSILRFKRFASYPNIDGVEAQADCFKDIAPPLQEVLISLTEGETYIVRGSGWITYRGVEHRQNERFTATTDLTFQRHEGAKLYVYDGIKHTALKKGFTNEWVMFMEPRGYHPSESSIWKPTAYSDYFTWCDRCHFYSGTAPARLRRFMAINNTTSPLTDEFNPRLNPPGVQATMLAPEAPDQFRYSAGANQTGTGSDEDFYSSCQVYNRPYEIESCVIDDWADPVVVPGRTPLPYGDQTIKITLKTRLRKHDNAPASVAVNPLSWSAGDIASLRNTGATPEDFRTDDNAIREYVLSLADGSKPCVFRKGDSGTGSVITGEFDKPFGSCYPVFYFSHLIPEPYDDGNDVMQLHDSRCVIDSMLMMETNLRAMCEGFIDGRTSQDIICRTGLGNLYDYTFENLCFDAFGGRWIGAFDLDDRTDNPAGFGPLPNSTMMAQVYNRLVSAVNLLDKVRLDLPIHFKNRTITSYGYRPLPLVMLRGTTTCTESGLVCGYADGQSAPGAGGPPKFPDETFQPGTWPQVGTWEEWTEISASQTATPYGCPFQIQSQRVDTEYRVEIDPDFWNAVPDELLEHINNSGTGFYAIYQTQINRYHRQVVDSSEGWKCPNEEIFGAFWFTDTEYYAWAAEQHLTYECILVNSGTLIAPPPPPNDYALGRQGIMTPETFCTTGSGGSASLTLHAEQGAFIQIPLA